MSTPEEDDLAAIDAGLIVTLFCMAVIVICLAVLFY